MANTYVLINSYTVGSGGVASVSLLSIPATYTDLLILASVRTLRSTNASNFYMRINGSSATNYDLKRLEGSGTAASSDGYTSLDGMVIGTANGSTSTASVFSSFSIYIPNYLSSNKKSVSVESVSENNATAAYADLTVGLWNLTSAITSVSFHELAANTNIDQYSTFYLYGIKNS